ncbi:hypothetical protein FJTKL_11258 [Diaporthe vaccinii]|uniref:Uncharacterized protein n=1 Tax=Diaporthe vaccinii TaxID=105482 RepID=A0ABR4EH85_9PEZI
MRGGLLKVLAPRWNPSQARTHTALITVHLGSNSIDSARVRRRRNSAAISAPAQTLSILDRNAPSSPPGSARRGQTLCKGAFLFGISARSGGKAHATVGWSQRPMVYTSV